MKISLKIGHDTAHHEVGKPDISDICSKFNTFVVIRELVNDGSMKVAQLAMEIQLRKLATKHQKIGEKHI